MIAIAKKFLPVLFALVLAFSLALVPCAVSASPGTIYVPGDYLTIQSAIDAAVDGDTILVTAGTYTERFEVDKQLTLIGDVNQPSNVVVNAPDPDKNVITLTVDGCVLRGFKVQNGKFGINLESNNNTLTGNIVTGNTIGVKIQETVDASTISINFNNIYGNTSYGIDNASTTSVDAENNWWGANDGPGPSPGSGDLVSANVDYDPWIVLGVSSSPTSIVADGSSTSTITADMTINSDSADTSGLGHIPDGTQIIFTTDKGSIGSLQVTKETINGKATAILTSSTIEETATVTAKAPPHTGVATDSTTVDFTLGGSLDHFTFDTISSPQTAGATFSITITAKDQDGNTVTSYTGTNTLSDTTGTINPSSTGSFAGGVWTGTVTITKAQTGVTIATTGTDKSGTSNSFAVTAGSLDHIVISPDTASITAGDSQTYTAEAFDQYDNSLGDVTNDATFEIVTEAGGSWAANVYTSENAGTWTVTGTYSGKSGTATLTVIEGPLDHIVISPDTASIAAGDSQTYTAEAFNQYDNSLGDVTNDTTFEIVTEAGGSWAVDVYTSENAGTWTVTGTYSDKSGTATLTVIEGVLPPTVSIDSPKDRYLTTDSTVTVEGTVVAIPALSEATLTVNGKSRTITVSDGAFSKKVTLVKGDNTITVSASNLTDTDSDSITVTRNSKPVVDITSPMDGAIFQATLITVDGTVDALPGVTEATLTLNGNISTITVTDGKFSETVNLVDGENTIVVSATNVAGAGTSTTITATQNKETAPTPLPPPTPPPSPPPPPSSTTNWWLIGGILGGIALIAFVVVRKFVRRY